MASFLHSWILFFSLRPLYQAALGPSHEPLLAPVTKLFRQLQQALLQATALHLPGLTLPFSLYVTEKEGYALGFLGYLLEPSFAPVSNLSKKLDHTTQGWEPCLGALAAAELLIRESKKLTYYCLLFSTPDPSSDIQASPNITPLQSSLPSGSISRGYNTYLSAMSTS